MRKLFLVFLFALVVAVFAALLMSHDSGYVRISWGHYLIETSAWVALALNILLFASIYGLIRAVQRARQSRGGLNSWLSLRGQNRARLRTTQGLLEFAEGNWSKAQRHLTHAASKADTPLINYLAAAQAAFEQGKEKETEALLKKAYESTPGADVAVGITQAQLQLAGNQFEQCLATLVRLRKNSPNHPFVLKLLRTVYLKLEDWHQLSLLIPELRRLRVGEIPELDKLEEQTWINLFVQAANDIRRQSGSSVNTEQLDSHWDRLPATMRKNDKVIHAYANQLIMLDANNQAEALLRKVLRNHWSDLLADLYGKVQSDHAEEQLITAEGWLKERPNNAVLLLALGRLCLRLELWGKAKEYFEASHQFQKTPESYGELCRLAIHMNDHKLSSEYMMSGILDQVGLPKLPMPKGG